MEEKDKITENDLKPKYKYAQKVLVEKVVLETARNNEDDIQRIRFETDKGNITFKPKKTKTETKERKGLVIETEARDVFTIDDLEQLYPVLFPLSNDVKKKPQEIVVTYVEKLFFSEREQEYETYYFMLPTHMNTLFYAGFHTDKENIEAQKDLQKKYAEKEL